MSEIASKQQLRLAFWRWAVVTVPFMLLLGFTAARLAPNGSNNAWYTALTKSAATPPDWAFPVAWTGIYILLGLSLAIVLHARGSRWRVPAVALFGVQLLVNLAWSPVFFGMHRITLALGVLATMLVLTLAMVLLFSRVRAMAVVLLIPYVAWLIFAAYLNYQIIVLNPGAETLAPPSTTTQVLDA